jgi:hypothetical protein
MKETEAKTDLGKRPPSSFSYQVKLVAAYAAIGVATRLFPRYMFDYVLHGRVHDGSGASVLAFLQFASSALASYPFCKTSMSNYDLMFVHWRVTVIPALFYIAKVMLALCAVETLNIGK